MASPIKESDIVILPETARICDRLRALIDVPAQFKAFLEWLLDSSGEISDAVVDSIQDRLTPVGVILAYGNPALGMPSSRWLVCNGQAVSRTTYATLFARVGITYGAGDASTTFNLPNLQDKFLVGSGGSYLPAATGGAASVTLNLEHYHGSAISGTNDNINFPTRSWSKTDNGTGATVGISGDDVDDADGPAITAGDIATTTELPTLAAVAVATLPPYIAVGWIIKAL